MNIIMLTNNINNIGGVEKINIILANYLSRMLKCNVTILSIYTKENKKTMIELDTEVKVIHMGFMETSSNRVSNFINRCKVIHKTLSRLNYDYCLAFHSENNICLSLLKHKLKGKIIGGEHGQYYYDSRARRGIKRIVYKNLDALVMLTERDKAIYEKYLDNVVVIPNPLVIETNNRCECKGKKIISVGRLSKEKSLNYLVEAFALCLKKHPSWQLEIVGDGPEKENLKALAKVLRIEDNIMFTGFTDKVEEKYGEAAFIVLTSQSECFPMVLLEAKLYGLPAVSFDTRTGPREIIEDGIDGLLVKQNDICDLSEKMSLLIENMDLREKMSINAFNNREKYNIENIVMKWKQLLEAKGRQ